MYLPVTQFEIIYEDNGDIVNLTFKINNGNFFMFPYYKKNIKVEIIDKFFKIIEGQKTSINLSFDSELQKHQSNILEFNNEYIVYNIVQSYGNNLIQESYFVFENNSIVRNGLRKFVYNYIL
jgi:hypothetical protein